nr:MAG TPA: hypothetical protein [Caudoviricetes sp.]
MQPVLIFLFSSLPERFYGHRNPFPVSSVRRSGYSKKTKVKLKIEELWK